MNSHFKGVVNLVRILNKKNLIKFVQIGSSVEYGKIKSPHIEPKKIPLQKKKFILFMVMLNYFPQFFL